MSQLKLPIGISDYKELKVSDCYFVDKSLFIQDVIDNGSKIVLFTRPRRFGKTINLSMLYYFLTDKTEQADSNLFSDTKISQKHEFCKKHQNQYPVIFISFRTAKNKILNLLTLQ